MSNSMAKHTRNWTTDVDFSVVTESPQIMRCVDLINKATKEQRTIKFIYTNSAGHKGGVSVMKQSWVLCPSAITRHEQKYG